MKKYVKSSKIPNGMSQLDIEVMLSETIRDSISNGAMQIVVRDIIYDCCKDVDWNKVYNVLVETMPELILKYDIKDARFGH